MTTEEDLGDTKASRTNGLVLRKLVMERKAHVWCDGIRLAQKDYRKIERGAVSSLKRTNLNTNNINASFNNHTEEILSSSLISR